MIDKVIHYCWFGGKELPELAKKCIESWHKYCPDYKIIEWNESNFNLDICAYVKEAYENKKWAFITDYVRLYVLYNYGGIYMDTDVEVIGSLDKFLEDKGFSGFENEHSVPTGIMASEKGNQFIYELLCDYKDKHFVLPDGQLDLTTNTKTITDLATNLGLKLDNTKQVLKDFTFYPRDYFCPKDSRTLKIHLTENSVTIHHFNGSWENQKQRKFKDFIKRILGEKLCLLISDRKYGKEDKSKD
jgi:hypothetical protein